MIFWVSVVLKRTVAVAFKFLKKAKHRSDLLNGLNITAQVSYASNTRRIASVFVLYILRYTYLKVLS